MNVKSTTAYGKRLKSLNQALSRFFVNSYSQIPYGIKKRGIFLIFFIFIKRPSSSKAEGVIRARARTRASNLLQPCSPLPIRQPIFGWKFGGSSPPWHRRHSPSSDDNNITPSSKTVPDILHRCRYRFFMPSSILRARRRVNKPPSKQFRRNVSVPLWHKLLFLKRVYVTPRILVL